MPYDSEEVLYSACNLYQATPENVNFYNCINYVCLVLFKFLTLVI